MSRRISLFFVLILFLSSCASTRMNPILSQEPDALLNKKEMKELTQKAEKHWDKRSNKDDLNLFIETQERIANDKLRTELDLIRLSRAYYLKGEYFSENTHQQMKMWEKAANWAETALTFNSKFKNKVLSEKIPTEQALDTLTKKNIDALYWFAVAFGKWASTQGLNTVLKYKDRIKKMIDRVAALQPNYFYGAVHRYNGVYYASLPGFNEEDLKNSRSHFDRALKRAPEYFSNHVLFAEYYAKKIEDWALFKKHLEFVIHGNAQQIKDLIPEQTLEQMKAKKLLEGNRIQ